MQIKDKISGFTLIELMITVSLNTVILGGLIGLFVANLNHYTIAITTNQLNQQLQSIMNLMASDIRRAGYWEGMGNYYPSSAQGFNYFLATTMYDLNLNPFQATANDIKMYGTAGSCPSSSGATTITCGTCIMVTYDHASAGPTTIPAISVSTPKTDDDRYGYRLNTTTHMLQTRPWGASFTNCSTASDWENMNDDTINITALTFQLNSTFVSNGMTSTTPGPSILQPSVTTTSGLIMRSVDITLTGELASNSAVTMTLQSHVRIRNDEFVPYNFPS